MKNHSIVALLAAVSFGVICTNCSSVVTALDNMTASLEAANAKLEAQNAASRAARESRTTTATASTPNTSATTTASTTTKTSNTTTASAKATTQNTTAATTAKTNSTTTTQTNTTSPSTTSKTTTTTPANVDSRAVDLGLSVLWASCNVGATRPEEFGNYYAWGETKPSKTTGQNNNANWKKYKFYKKQAYGGVYFTKYGSNEHCVEGKGDYKKVLEPEDDAASVYWGGKWRTPTSQEWDELLRYTTQGWTEMNGVPGFLFTSIKNGNTLFLPATEPLKDCRIDGSGDGIYWASDLIPYGERFGEGVFSFRFIEKGDNGIERRQDRYRFEALSVRPVYPSPTWVDPRTVDITFKIESVSTNENDFVAYYYITSGQDSIMETQVSRYPDFRDAVCREITCFGTGHPKIVEAERTSIICDLKPNTKYYWRFKAIDTRGKVFYSETRCNTTKPKAAKK